MIASWHVHDLGRSRSIQTERELTLDRARICSLCGGRPRLVYLEFPVFADPTFYRLDILRRIFRGVVFPANIRPTTCELLLLANTAPPLPFTAATNIRS